MEEIEEMEGIEKMEGVEGMEGVEAWGEEEESSSVACAAMPMEANLERS